MTTNMNRRSFIRRSAVAGSGLVASGSLPRRLRIAQEEGMADYAELSAQDPPNVPALP